MSARFVKFERTKTLEAKGGIKAGTARGKEFGSNWWSRRWVEALKESIDPGRFARGKSYARKGQVLNISVRPGIAEALVQGSSRQPYKVKLSFKTVSDGAKESIIFRFRENAALTASLLVSEMPEQTEQIFKEAGVPLFPDRRAIRGFICTCPDSAVPCKHIIAVLLLVGEVLQDDPFMLLKLRGLDKESLISALTLENTDTGTEDGEQTEDVLVGGAEEGRDDENAALSDAVPTAEENWYEAKDFSFEAAVMRTSCRVAFEAMNDFPFWRGELTFRQSLAPIYDRAAEYAAEIIIGKEE